MQEELVEIKGHLNRVTHELNQMKRIFIRLEVKDRQKAERAWDDLASVSKEIFKGVERRNSRRIDWRPKREETMIIFWTWIWSKQMKRKLEAMP